ncbi:glycosyltransferase family 9 protein [Uliginosibacterium sp. H3]|uniref:Glycosyltransferase family 9 protein n=1 Tax=Uliginosibacterium silvisoli TaxID=3114758 RepID=A0ABU6K1P1_9RHOO|nr:glycosyltransferase family 9 protein [Uliginosibacterium sp. H3]
MSRLPSRLLLQPLLLAGSVRALLGPRGYPQNPRRILVAHHLLLGDTLMLSALLAKLRHQHPDAEIVMTCPKAILPLYASKPWGVRAMAYDPRDVSTLRALSQQRGFDLALVPGDSRYSWLARGLGARYIVAQADDTPDYKNWFVDEQRAWPREPAALPEIFAGLARGEDAPAFASAHWPLPACKDFTLPDLPYAVLHLGASTSLKFWPAERWQALAAALQARGITPVWSAGKKETELVTAADPQGRFRSYAGQLDLLQLAHLLRGARLLVGPDTGVTHLGRITATPTVTLFGPGSEVLCAHAPFFRDTPAVALSARIACRNQQIIFRRKIDWVQRCGRGFEAASPVPTSPQAPRCGQALCMEQIGFDDVLDACQQLLESPRVQNSSQAHDNPRVSIP